MKKIMLIFGIIFLGLTGFSQETMTTDPVLKAKHFAEIGFSIHGTRINTEYPAFKTDNGWYFFDKASWLPALDGVFRFGWILKSKDESLWLVKTGLDLTNTSANLTDIYGSKLRFQESFIQIPVLYGIHYPRQYNPIHNNLFRAIDLYAGFYLAIPYYEKLDLRENLDTKPQNSFATYLRTGMTGEIVFSSLNEKGRGNKFAIRTYMDFKHIMKFKGNETGLYPYYYSVGLVYYLLNVHN
jgi:hypothetical protein